MLRTLDLCGLEFDGVQRQDQHLDLYHETLLSLQREGLIYVCECTRKDLRAANRRTPEGGFVYDNRFRNRHWDGGPYTGNLRLNLGSAPVAFQDPTFGLFSMNVDEVFGDPIVVRRDGAFSYHFASTIDDHHSHVTDVVRGRDLLWSTPPQLAIRRSLNFPAPRVHHHPLLLESQDAKLAKLHGSLPVGELLAHLSPQMLIGELAYLMGLVAEPNPCPPDALISGFDWTHLPRHDWLVEWQPPSLTRTAVDWPELPSFR